MTQIHSPSPTEHSSFTGRPINRRLLLTVSEAAAALRISRSSIYRLFDAGEVELASDLLRVASESGKGEWAISRDGMGIINGRYARRATDVEALTAVILQRAGVPWDALAAPAEVSKQALHRRLGPRGEALFAESLRESDQRITNPRALIRFLHKAEQAQYLEELSEVLRPLQLHSEDLIFHLVELPMPEDILWAPTQLAERFSELRKIPRWWWSWG
jgi:hypothetical protein